MENGILGGPRRESGQPGVPPFRPFKDLPSGIWIQHVADVIRKTGEPEKVDGLYHGKIGRDAKFRKLRIIEIDRRKRPNGDMAPCPRCRRADQFLSGYLAWFPDLQFCAVIGHCCASKEALSEAERKWKRDENRRHQEDVLLSGLPKLALRSQLLSELRSPAGEALRIYRKFRKEASFIHKHLRELKHRRGGHLTLTEVLNSADNESESDYIGPSGFRGRGSDWVETRDIDFGFIAGQTAIEKSYDPIKQIDNVARILDSFDARPTEEEALELIVSMNDRYRAAAVAVLQELDRGYDKVANKLIDFWEFFSESNIRRLGAYGTHRENPQPFGATYETDGKRRLIVFKQGMSECRLSFDEKFANFRVDWPKSIP